MMITVSFYEAVVFVSALLGVAFMLGMHNSRIKTLEKGDKKRQEEREALMKILSDISQRLSRIEGRLNHA